MLRWDLAEQKRVIDEERRRQALRQDFEYSGDDDSVISDDGGALFFHTALHLLIFLWSQVEPGGRMMPQ